MSVINAPVKARLISWISWLIHGYWVSLRGVTNLSFDRIAFRGKTAKVPITFWRNLSSIVIYIVLKIIFVVVFFGAVCGYLITCSRNWRLYTKNYTTNWTICTDNNRKIHMKQLNYLTIVTNNLKLTELFQIPTRRKRRSLFIIYFSIVIFLEF